MPPDVPLAGNKQRLFFAVVEDRLQLPRAAGLLRLEYPAAGLAGADTTVHLTLETDGTTGMPLTIGIFGVAGEALWLQNCTTSVHSRNQYRWDSVVDPTYRQMRDMLATVVVTTTYGNFTGPIRPVGTSTRDIVAAAVAQGFVYGAFELGQRAAIAFVAITRGGTLSYAMVSADDDAFMQVVITTAADHETSGNNTMTVCDGVSNCELQHNVQLPSRHADYDLTAAFDDASIIATTEDLAVLNGRLRLVHIAMTATSSDITSTAVTSPLHGGGFLAVLREGPGRAPLRSVVISADDNVNGSNPHVLVNLKLPAIQDEAPAVFPLSVGVMSALVRGDLQVSDMIAVLGHYVLCDDSICIPFINVQCYAPSCVTWLMAA